MMDYKVKLVGVSPKRKSSNVLDGVDADYYQQDSQEFIKLYLTRHDIQHRNFYLNNGAIVLGDKVFRILEVSFLDKRPKYAICRVEPAA